VNVVVEEIRALDALVLINVLPMAAVSSFFWAKTLAVKNATVTKAAIENRFEDIFPPEQGFNDWLWHGIG
jgi:hypothetical protein